MLISKTWIYNCIAFSRFLKIVIVRDYDKLMQLKLQTDSSYRKMRDELIDSEQLLKSVPDGFNEVDKKYEDVAED
jgi:hypothetical protein